MTTVRKHWKLRKNWLPPQSVVNLATVRKHWKLSDYELIECLAKRRICAIEYHKHFSNDICAKTLETAQKLASSPICRELDNCAKTLETDRK